MVIIERCSSPSNTESFVEVSSQPGPSSRCSGGSNWVGVSLTHYSPSARNYDDQLGSLSPTFDDLESFSSSPSMSYLQPATQKEIRNVDQLISVFIKSSCEADSDVVPAFWREF